MKEFTLNTNGKGYWSNKAKEVTCTDIKVFRNSGELRLKFDTSTWSTSRDGLIYTDEQFEKEFKEYLTSIGFDKKSLKGLGYSEQGMQGNDYVSFDVDDKFMNKFKEVINK